MPRREAFRQSSSVRHFAIRAAAAIALTAGLAACASEPITKGYILDEKALAEVKPGLEAQKVLQIMGTPSTVSTVGNQTWYYISQMTTERARFLGPSIVDQRVIAINFSKNMKVERVANYGMQDGVVFDFVTRTTPTGGNELSVVRQLMRGAGLSNTP
ncbi:outer membrane protein assembly factor BamE [Alsobacter sp. SYSU M60028]|uniref:Outer membrane protein assembly factor BamE n=1 Tax=Alsobacter ponti TaxID=2962936 RepID=A0ABT1LA87_9HYPH|nr:outer membrane protein assembly factor BamE [Alsobacter ponti]MCP8938349.1 outer membrane protein assembly factor BamE [Alsobacter ponti]